MTSPTWTFLDEASDVSGVDWSAAVTRRTMFHDPRALLAVVASRHEAAVLDVLK